MSTHSAPTPTKTRIARTLLATAAVMAIASTGCVAVANSAAAAPTGAPTTQTAASAQVGTVEHTNNVDFVGEGIIVSYNYSGKYQVSSGQPWNGVTSTPSTHSAPAVITAKAGDHNTAAPAQWFTGSLQNRWGNNPDAIVSDTAVAQTPHNLFFAFNGGLTINGTNYNTVIGESPAGYLNNTWWIGGTVTQVGTGTWTTIRTANHGTALITPDGKYEIQASTYNNHTFNVLPYRPAQG